jgi:hypothetical protein
MSQKQIFLDGKGDNWFKRNLDKNNHNNDDLFKVSCEANRVLKTNGHMIIQDFEPSNEYYNIYHHKSNVLSHKMDFSKMFTWSKNYFIRFKQVFNHENSLDDIYDEDSRVSINILLKKNDIYRK